MPTVKIQRALKTLIPSSIKYLNRPQQINRWPNTFPPLPMQCCFIVLIN